MAHKLGLGWSVGEGRLRPAAGDVSVVALACVVLAAVSVHQKQTFAQNARHSRFGQAGAGAGWWLGLAGGWGWLGADLGCCLLRSGHGLDDQPNAAALNWPRASSNRRAADPKLQHVSPPAVPNRTDAQYL